MKTLKLKNLKLENRKIRTAQKNFQSSIFLYTVVTAKLHHLKLHRHRRYSLAVTVHR